MGVAMNTKEQAVKRGRGRPPKTEEERLNDGKLTVYLGADLPELVDMATRQGLRYSEFARQGILVHMERFRRAA